MMKEKRYYPWLVVALLWVVALLNYMDRQMLSTMQEAMKADIEELSRMKDFVVGAAGQAGLSTKDTKRLRLAVEEAVTNVIMYAYDGCQSRPLSIRTNTTDDALLVTVTDEGRPFDPTKAPMADTTLPPDKRPEGGLGILFIHQMSDGLDYRREDGRNILTIRKNLNAKYAS